MNKFIQYELWKDCRNKCPFCYNRNERDINKIKSLDFITNRLLDIEVDNYNEIGFIGGEFFEDQLNNLEVKEKFYNLFKICSEKKYNNKLNKLYICSSLIYNINTYLLEFLNYLKSIDLLGITLLCTSYDTIYRFNSISENTWKNNILKLHELYPELKIHVEIILTQDFINKVLLDEFDINKFKNDYSISIDYSEPSTGNYYHNKQKMNSDLNLFFPTKSSFIKFIMKTYKNNSIDFNLFLDKNLRSNTLYYTDNGVFRKIEDRRDGHNKILKFITDNDSSKLKDFNRGFIDSDKSMIEIVNQFLKVIGNNV